MRHRRTELAQWKQRVAEVATVCGQSAPRVAWRASTSYNRHADVLGIGRFERRSRRGSEPARRAAIAHELGHRASSYRKADRIDTQWARASVRVTAAAVVLIEAVLLTILGATSVLPPGWSITVAWFSVVLTLGVLGSVLLAPLLGEFHGEEYAADDYAADHTGTPGTVESLWQLRTVWEPVMGRIPVLSTHPNTRARIARQHARAATRDKHEGAPQDVSGPVASVPPSTQGGTGDE